METKATLNNDAVTKLLENIMSNDDSFMDNTVHSKEMIETSFDYTCMITKATDDDKDFDKVSKMADLYDNASHDRFVNYTWRAYGKTLKDLGAERKTTAE